MRSAQTRATSTWRALGAALGLGAGIGLYSVLLEPRWLRLRRQAIPIAGLPPAFDGFRVGMLSDLHAGNWADRRLYQRAVEALDREQVDLAVLTGDIVGNRAHPRWREDLAPLARLSPPAGRFAVLGGHDRRNGGERVTARMTELGWTVLLNEGQPLRRGADTLWLLGVDDNSLLPLRDDLEAAAAAVPLGAPSILLAHSPDAIFGARRRRISLVLSGHTHGGQVRLPGVGALLQVTDLPKRFDSGLSRHGGSWLYVSRGVASTYPLRFLCRPEVQVLTLRAA